MTPLTVTVRPKLLRWARERAGLTPDQLAERVDLRTERVTNWEATGEIKLTHLQRLAEKTHTPVGYLFLPDPPTEELPVADFRRIGSDALGGISVDLRETIQDCQRRQAWYREFLVGDRARPLPFVGSATEQDDPTAVAADIRATLRLDDVPLVGSNKPEDVLRTLVARAGDAGILVMRNGVVGNN